MAPMSRSGAPKSSRGRVVPRPSESVVPCQHHRARVAARHREVGRVRTWVDPGALAERPAIPRCGFRLPAGHFDDAVIDLEFEAVNEPAAHFAERQSVPHRHCARADEAFPARSQARPSTGRPRRIRPVEYPHALAEPCCGLQHVTQRRDERVDAAAEVLQVDEQHVERVEHRVRGAAHFAVEAENQYAKPAAHKIRATPPCCPACRHASRAAGRSGRQPHVVERGQCVERMREIGRDRRGMREQRHAAAAQVFAQSGVGREAVDAELHGPGFRTASRSRSVEPAGCLPTWSTKPSR